MIEVVQGNILDATESYICQQVNCQGVMGAGLAKAISDKYPCVKIEYLRFCNTLPVNQRLGAVHGVNINDKQCVLNIFGQYNYGRNPSIIYTDYNALEIAFCAIAHWLPQYQRPLSLAFPYNFGCGLANGNWGVIYSLLMKYFDVFTVRIYKYD